MAKKTKKTDKSSDEQKHKEAIGKRIRAVREFRGLSQAEVARRIQKNNVDVYRWEKTGIEPKTDSLVSLAKILEVDVQWLFRGGDGGPVPDPINRLRGVSAANAPDVPFVVAEFLATQRVAHVTVEEIAFLAREVSDGIADVDGLEIRLLARRAADTRRPDDVAAFNAALERQGREHNERKFDLTDSPEPPSNTPLKAPKRVEPKAEDDASKSPPPKKKR